MYIGFKLLTVVIVTGFPVYECLRLDGLGSILSIQLHVMDGCLSITPLKIPRPSYLSFVDLAIIEEKEKVGLFMK